jgi:hypothetical protein
MHRNRCAATNAAWASACESGDLAQLRAGARARRGRVAERDKLDRQRGNVIAAVAHIRHRSIALQLDYD